MKYYILFNLFFIYIMILCFDQYIVRNRVLQKWKISSKLFSYNKNMTYYDARNIIFFACFLIAP